MSGMGAAVVGDATGQGLRDESEEDTTVTAVENGARRTGTVGAAARERCAVEPSFALYDIFRQQDPVVPFSFLGARLRSVALPAVCERWE